jgi:uncharacterized cofD-like protein
MNQVQGPHIVVIGGGTGSFTLLNALKNHTDTITALVNMADDGGSTGLLRDEFGVLPPGDIRQCLVALSQSSDELRELFNYRYPHGSTMEGHSFGNLLLSTVEMMTDDFARAVELASRVLNITGKVVPITLTNCMLVLQDGNQLVKGQHEIKWHTFDHRQPNVRLYLEPDAHANPEAVNAIAAADMVVIAPGNLYASLVPAMLVDGIRQALDQAKARVVYICNLVNKPHHTKDFAVHDYVNELETYIGKGTIDCVLYNIDIPTPELIKKYAHDNEYPVRVEQQALDEASYMAYGGHFLAANALLNPNDTLIKRSLIRHNAEAVVTKLMELAEQARR